MKKTTILTIISAVVIVPLFLLALSINENKAEQKAINAVPAIKRLEPRSAEWGKHYQRQYDSYRQTRKSDEIMDMWNDNPPLVRLSAGYGVSEEYNAPRGHYYILEDNINTLVCDMLDLPFNKGQFDCVIAFHSVFHTDYRGLKKIILSYQPRLVICGHIHERPGTAFIGDTRIVNCSMGRSGAGAIIDVDGDGVSEVEMI